MLADAAEKCFYIDVRQRYAELAPGKKMTFVVAGILRISAPQVITERNHCALILTLYLPCSFYISPGGF